MVFHVELLRKSFLNAVSLFLYTKYIASDKLLFEEVGLFC